MIKPHTILVMTLLIVIVLSNTGSAANPQADQLDSRLTQLLQNPSLTETQRDAISYRMANSEFEFVRRSQDISYFNVQTELDNGGPRRPTDIFLEVQFADGSYEKVTLEPGRIFVEAPDGYFSYIPPTGNDEPWQRQGILTVDVPFPQENDDDLAEIGSEPQQTGISAQSSQPSVPIADNPQFNGLNPSQKSTIQQYARLGNFLILQQDGTAVVVQDDTRVLIPPNGRPGDRFVQQGETTTVFSGEEELGTFNNEEMRNRLGSDYRYTRFLANLHQFQRIARNNGYDLSDTDDVESLISGTGDGVYVNFRAEGGQEQAVMTIRNSLADDVRVDQKANGEYTVETGDLNTDGTWQNDGDHTFSTFDQSGGLISRREYSSTRERSNPNDFDLEFRRSGTDPSKYTMVRRVPDPKDSKKTLEHTTNLVRTVDPEGVSTFAIAPNPGSTITRDNKQVPVVGIRVNTQTPNSFFAALKSQDVLQAEVITDPGKPIIISARGSQVPGGIIQQADIPADLRGRDWNKDNIHELVADLAQRDSAKWGALARTVGDEFATSQQAGFSLFTVDPGTPEKREWVTATDANKAAFINALPQQDRAALTTALGKPIEQASIAELTKAAMAIQKTANDRWNKAHAVRRPAFEAITSCNGAWGCFTNFFSVLFRGYEEYRGLSAYSSLFLDDEDLAKRRAYWDEKFCEMGIGGTDCWTTRMCQSFSDFIPHPAQGIVADVTAGNQYQWVAHIESEKSPPTEFINETTNEPYVQYIYRTTYAVKVPSDAGNVSYNVIYKGPQTPNGVAWFADNDRRRVISPGGSASRTGPSADAFYSRRNYTEVCIIANPPIPRQSGGSVNEVCNVINPYTGGATRTGSQNQAGSPSSASSTSSSSAPNFPAGSQV